MLHAGATCAEYARPENEDAAKPLHSTQDASTPPRPAHLRATLLNNGIGTDRCLVSLLGYGKLLARCVAFVTLPSCALQITRRPARPPGRPSCAAAGADTGAHPGR